MEGLTKEVLSLKKELKKLRKANKALQKKRKRRDSSDSEEDRKERRRERKRRRKEKEEKRKNKKEHVKKRKEKEKSAQRKKRASAKRKENAGVSVANRFEEGGTITIKDGSYKKNRPFRRYIKMYIDEKDPQKKKLYHDRISEMLAEAMIRGNTVYNESVPRELLKSAGEILENEHGMKASFETMDTSSGASSSSSAPPTSDSSDTEPKKTFLGKMEMYSIDMTKYENKGFMQNLIQVQPTVAKILSKASKQHKQFRFFLEHVVKLGKGFSEDGSMAEEREATLSSGGDMGGMIIVRSPDKEEINKAISKAYSRLMEQLSDFNDRGSGLEFLESLRMDVSVSEMAYGRNRYFPFKKDDAPEQQSSDPTTSSEESEKGGTWIPMPMWAAARGAVVNVKTLDWKKDNRCFEWSIIRALNPITDPSRKRWLGKDWDIRQYLDKLVKLPEGVTYPIPIDCKTLRKIEEINEAFSFSVFIIGSEMEDVQPYYISEWKGKPGREKHIQLGLVSDEEQGIRHFVWIKSMHRLMVRQYSAVKTKNTRYFCENCLSAHRSVETLRNHEEICGRNEPTRIEMPKVDSKDHKLVFKTWQYLLPVPFVFYCDFESALVKEGDKQVHKVSAFSYRIHSTHKEYFESVLGWRDKKLFEMRNHVGEGALDLFFEALFSDGTIVSDIVLRNKKPYERRDGDIEKFRSAKECHICLKPLIQSDEDKVLDHDHLTGLYRGAAHRDCNVRYSHHKNFYFKIPVIFHNLKGYDGYHVLRGLEKQVQDGSVFKIDVIAKNLEKFTSITINQFRFIDSFQFIPSSLEKQVENLVKDCKSDEKLLRDRFRGVFDYIVKNHDRRELSLNVSSAIADEKYGSKQATLAFQTEKWFEKAMRLCCAKGEYPYEWVDSYEKMSEKSLPPMKDFWSSLKQEGMEGERGEKDYARAKEMWRIFGCKTMADYTRLYCDLDVLQLESIFELFRKTSLSPDNIRMDPAHFVTAPSMTWAAMLKMNFDKDLVIENMTDVDHLLMVENGIRGGMCQVMQSYGWSRKETSQERMDELGLADEDYDENRYSDEYDDDPLWDVRLLYLDANNLYGWAMMQPLPEGDYRMEYGGEKRVDQTCDPNERYLFTKRVEEQRAAKKEGDQSPPENESKPAQSKGHYIGPWRIDTGWRKRAPAKGRKPVDYWKKYENDMPKMSKHILRINWKAPRGYIFEVDLDVPKEIHDKVNSYPLCPERKIPEPSPFTISEMERLGVNSSNVEKLVQDLLPKKNYVIHLRNLQQALSLGYKLTKVHRVLSFKQSPWLADYVRFWTDKRKGAKNSVEKEFFKLLINSLFGKTMEQVRKRRNVKFYFKKTLLKAVREASGPYVKNWKIINSDSLMIMEMAKRSTMMNRPVILGMCILDLSKWLMYDFYYNKLKKSFDGSRGSAANLVYTDTDSLVVQLRGKRGYTVNSMLCQMQRDFDCFDVSETENKNHPLYLMGDDNYLKANAKEPGKFKDELKGHDIDEVIALRAKMYYVKMSGTDGPPLEDKQKTKGIPEKSQVLGEKRRLGYQDYIDALGGEPIKRISFHTIAHDKQFNLNTKVQVKLGVVAADDKSYYMNHLESYRYGHYRIEEILREEKELLKEIQEKEEREEYEANIRMLQEDAEAEDQAMRELEEANIDSLFMDTIDKTIGMDLYEEVKDLL